MTLVTLLVVNPGPRSLVDRIDYSNDTATASPKGPLSGQEILYWQQVILQLWIYWWWNLW